MILLNADSNSIGLSGAQGSAFLGVPHSAVCGRLYNEQPQKYQGPNTQDL